MKVSLNAALLGALALVLISAPAAPAVPAPHSRLARQVVPPPDAPPVFQWAAPVPARQLHLDTSGSPNAPYFLGRSRASSPAAPSPTSIRSSTGSAAPRVALYGGLNQPGINATHNTFAETPPDSTGAIGRTHYVEVANSVIHVWGRDLSNVSSSTLDNFIGAASNYPLCDPQIQWDAPADRWLILFLFCSTSGSTGGFYYGWSKTADPSDLVNGWCIFGDATGSSLFDYPKLGHSSLYIIFGGNFYGPSPSANPPFQGAAIAWAALPANGVTTCSSAGVNGTPNALVNGDGLTPAFTPVPVNTMTNADNGYIVSSYDVGSNVQAPTPQSKLAVWHLDAGGILHADPDVVVTTFSAPAPAPQLGSTNKIDTLDGRLTQAVGDPTTGIWTQHTVMGGAGAMVAWYQLTASGTALTLAQIGSLSSTTDYIFNAAISPSFSARGTVVEYSRSSPTIDPVIAAQVRSNSTPAGTMAAGELVLATSSAADTDGSCNAGVPGTPCRWGDYSAASPDPVQPWVVWGTNEINTSTGTTPAWSDENFAIWAAVPPGAPTITGTVAGDQSVCVSWTPSTLESGAPDLSYTIRVYQGVTVVKTVIVNAPASTGCVSGLTDGTVYTFTVAATNGSGTGAESAPSGPVTPTRGVAQSSTAPSPGRTGVLPGPSQPPPTGR